MPTAHTARGVVASLSAAFWAAVYLVAFKEAGANAPRALVVLVMLSVATVLNTGAAWLRGSRWRVDRIAVVTGLVLAACTVVGNVAVAESLAHAEPAVTSIIMQTQIFFVAFGERLALRQRLNARLLLGSSIALAGFVVMHAPWGQRSFADVAGAAWAVLAAACFAIMLVLTRGVIQRIDPIWVNALRLWMAVGGLMLVGADLQGLMQMDTRAWALAAVAGICGPTVSRLFLMRSVRYLSASYSKLVNLVGPVFALALGVLFLSEMPAAVEMAGGALILAGVAYPLAVPERNPTPAA